jgi:two-component system response regulator PilR (NtrC family)
LLLQYSYPGNVRERENLVEHAVALCDGETATQDHLPAYLMTAQDQVRKVGVSRPAAPQPILASVASPPPDRSPVDLDRDLAEYEKAVLLRALDQAGGVKKKAAELLGINYRSLRHRLQKYGISDSMDDVG